MQHPQLIHCCRNMQLSHCCVLSPASSMEWLSRILTRADRVSTLFGIPAFSPCTGHSFLLLLYTPVHKHGDYAEFWRTQQNIFVESDLFDPLDLFLTLVRVMGWSRQLRMTWQNLDACNAEQSHLRSRWRPFCTGAQTLYFLYLARELVANNIFSALKGQFVCKNNKGWMGRWRKDFCKEFLGLMLDKTFLPLKRI